VRVNAGQPELSSLVNQSFCEKDLKQFEQLNVECKNSKSIFGREHR
jgi:hypothetical protein